MKRLAGAVAFISAVLVLGIAVVPGGWLGRAERAQAQDVVTQVPLLQIAVPKLVVKTPPTVDDVVRSGVLIVVSKASQRMYVFKDGALWDSSPVSTGKRGHGTPAGVFPILQKKAFHRSNIYSNAPMPYMQRLTWRGIAIHAGRLPGYPASHGCIRLPYSFARALFSLTRADATTVVVTNEPLRSDQGALTLALDTQAPPPVIPGMQVPPRVTVAAAAAPPVLAGPGQTIQLAAAMSPAEAEAHWLDLVSAHPELGAFRKSVVPAVVGARRFYRLRASAPGAYAYCASLRRAGQDCFNVT
ncbi:L,D-transpeptidase family protein [Novosphingobium sp. MMS21-SN21R]|uniref:L,D-transpeptidase family protein n=1 Tax=Novosphingobium sp. MMS21-SN21R TaxID=2969298 RepID=UPI0028884BC9|nr:L,D-transpeptidase family protein [Novosphingobium sp. MMS21-SN21R]MDT0507895.1 L,D-transpeptidase family protein [Novosphingobium sp. MMS21-SN21R]